MRRLLIALVTVDSSSQRDSVSTKAGHLQKNLTQFFCLFVITIMLLGCASILSESQYPVTFDSNPSGAHLKIVNRAGDTVYEGTSPTTITLEASSGFFRGERYKVVASVNGGSSTSTLTPTLDGWYIGGNILFGGLIGWLIVDPATGAMYKLPSKHTTTIGSKKSSIDLRLHVANIADLTLEQRASLVAIQSGIK